MAGGVRYPPIVPVPSIIDLVSSLLAVLLTSMSAQVRLNMAPSGEVDLAQIACSSCENARVKQYPAAHPVTKPRTP